MFSFLKPSVVLASCFIAYKSSSVEGQILRMFSEQKASESNLTKSYIWGNGFYKPRPGAALRFQNYEPKLITSFLGKENLNFKSLSFGEHHEGGIDLEDNFYVWQKHRLNPSCSPEIDDGSRNNLVKLDDSGLVKQIAFSKGCAWCLRKNGDVYFWRVKSIPDFPDPDDEDVVVNILKPGVKIEALKDITQIATGEDHFAAVDSQGHVWTMGDDTYGIVATIKIRHNFNLSGQCGQGSRGRKTYPPFFTQRIQTPTRIENFANVQKVVCGGNHTVAVTNKGVAYGWGSNSNLQLSHEAEFSAENSLIAIFKPLRFEKHLAANFVLDIAAGEEHTIFVSRSNFSEETEVFGCGKNLVGQLGTGNLSHIKDVAKIESLSNYKVKLGQQQEEEENITIKQLSCGNNHCMALLSVGALLEWGANDCGQLGNRKRTFSEHPIIVSEFTGDNVLSINAGWNNCSAVVENNPELEKLKKQNARKKKSEQKKYK